ncbi:MAG: hypothetical protein ACLGH6_00180 [Gammaproteobacteria bacterium]
MSDKSNAGAGMMLGVFIFAGLLGLGYQLADGFLEAKALERTVTVKGLSEREVPADSPSGRSNTTRPTTTSSRCTPPSNATTA